MACYYKYKLFKEHNYLGGMKRKYVGLYVERMIISVYSTKYCTNFYHESNILKNTLEDETLYSIVTICMAKDTTVNTIKNMFKTRHAFENYICIYDW